MELDSYGIYSYFTGNVNNIQLSTIQTIDISSEKVKTAKGVFYLDKKLGAGTYGKTYATLPVEGKSYAIKIMDMRNSKDIYNTLSEVIMNIILAEGTQSMKNGPFVPELYEFGITADQTTAIIRSERLVDTVFNYLQRKSPLENNTLVPQLILNVMNMLEILEKKYQFNHRDLKSDNIMYILKNGQPVWKFIDLGGACMKWNSFSIRSDSIFDVSRPCFHPGRDITFLLTELLLDVPITSQLKTSLHNLTTFPIYGHECALNSEDCPHASYKKWVNIYNVLNKTNVINPKTSIIKSELNNFLQKLKRPLLNWTFRKAKRHGRHRTRRN